MIFLKIKNSKALKKHNQYTLLTEIIKRQPISRSELTQHLDVSHTTISYLVKNLMEKDLVDEFYADSTGGRPPKLLNFKGDNKYIISISFKNKKILLGIYNLNFKLVDKTILNLKSESFQMILYNLNNLIYEKYLEYDIQDHQIYGVGLSIPGIYKKDKDIIINSTTNYLDQIHIKRELQNIFDTEKLYIDNDANLAVYYEWSQEQNKKYDNLIYIYVVEGIGSGFIVNNSLYVGSHGNAGEIGHMKVKSDGKKCSCGGIGCLETIFSIKAIENDFNEAINKGKSSIITKKYNFPFNYREIIEAYQKNDPLSRNIMNRAIKYFVRALSSIINIFDPQIIILGGIFEKFNEEMMNYVNKELEKTYFPDINDQPLIINKNDKQNYQLNAVTSFVFDQWKTNI
jgi:predicted NBD/HSP70 family sugar kinase